MESAAPYAYFGAANYESVSEGELSEDFDGPIAEEAYEEDFDSGTGSDVEEEIRP
jgi:hypothetical protein